jgi:hypothetical protein
MIETARIIRLYGWAEAPVQFDLVPISHAFLPDE